MSDEMREKVARIVDVTAMLPMTGKVFPEREAEALRKADAILALIASELERVERERDEALESLRLMGS